MKTLFLLGGLALLGGCAAERPQELSQADEARLATALADFEQDGPAMACVNSRDLEGNRSVGETAIIFEGVGRRIWVNRPAGGCPSLDHGRALQTRTSSTRLCRGDIATVFDPVSGLHYGGCGLGDFTPYRRRPSAS